MKNNYRWDDASVTKMIKYLGWTDMVIRCKQTQFLSYWFDIFGNVHYSIITVFYITHLWEPCVGKTDKNWSLYDNSTSSAGSFIWKCTMAHESAWKNGNVHYILNHTLWDFDQYCEINYFCHIMKLLNFIFFIKPIIVVSLIIICVLEWVNFSLHLLKVLRGWTEENFQTIFQLSKA